MLLFLVDATLSYGLANRFADLAYDRALASEVLALAARVAPAGTGVRVDLPEAALQIFEADEHDRVFYRVSDGRGNLVFGHRELALPPVAPGHGEQPVFYDTRVLGERLRVAAVSLPAGGSSGHPSAVVAVGETLVKRRILAREILGGMLVPQLALVALAAVLVWLGVGRGLRPLEAVVDAIRRRSHQDLSPLREAAAPLEVRPMVHAINGLFDQLSSTIAAQRRFVANAAHQLRTPLAGLKTQTELARRERNPDALAHCLAQIQAATERGAHLVNQLLALARAEPGADHPDAIAPLNLGHMAKEVATEWVAAAQRKSIDLGFEGTAVGTSIKGDPLLLRELLSNLLDNAIRYTPAGGRVTVLVDCEDRGLARLSVEDNGPGIPDPDRERVLERFHRILGTGEPGCGLGLAIVREIADRHGASVRVTEGANGCGTRVTVSFPPG
jgi:two-component system sensor histidine kinase TctE